MYEDDEEFITTMLWRVADGGGITGKRAARIAAQREDAKSGYEHLDCSEAFPCHHCMTCEREYAR